MSKDYADAIKQALSGPIAVPRNGYEQEGGVDQANSDLRLFRTMYEKKCRNFDKLLKSYIYESLREFCERDPDRAVRITLPDQTTRWFPDYDTAKLALLKELGIQ